MFHKIGIINPSEMATANSIEIAIWTAIGGRGTSDWTGNRCNRSQFELKAGSR